MNLHGYQNNHPVINTSSIKQTLLSFPVCIENILVDISELEKGMDLVRREVSSPHFPAASPLREFLAASEDKLRRLRQDATAAVNQFRDCVEAFGEPARGSDANRFFPLLVSWNGRFKWDFVYKVITTYIKL